MSKTPNLIALAFLAALSFSAQPSFAQTATTVAGSKLKTTVIQRINGNRFIIRTDAAGTKVTEQGSGRLVWSSDRDSHRDKVVEYTRGDVGKVISGPEK